MPVHIREAADGLEQAIWLGQRVRRFGAITVHPLFSGLFGRLLEGQSPIRIAAWVQSQVPADDPLGVGNLTLTALWRRLYRFRAALPPQVFAPRGVLQNVFERLDAGIDVLAAMDSLIRLQMTRISTFYDKEKNFPVPLEAMRREITTLSDLLMHRRDTAIALGLHPGATVPGTPQATVQVVNVNQLSPAGRKVAEMLHANPTVVGEFTEMLDRLEQVIDVTPRPELGPGDDEPDE